MSSSRAIGLHDVAGDGLAIPADRLHANDANRDLIRQTGPFFRAHLASRCLPMWLAPDLQSLVRSEFFALAEVELADGLAGQLVDPILAGELEFPEPDPSINANGS